MLANRKLWHRPLSNPALVLEFTFIRIARPKNLPLVTSNLLPSAITWPILAHTHFIWLNYEVKICRITFWRSLALLAELVVVLCVLHTVILVTEPVKTGKKNQWNQKLMQTVAQVSLSCYKLPCAPRVFIFLFHSLVFRRTYKSNTQVEHTRRSHKTLADNFHPECPLSGYPSISWKHLNFS